MHFGKKLNSLMIYLGYLFLRKFFITNLVYHRIRFEKSIQKIDINFQRKF